jgi:adenosylcobinamide kinase/adenosylcobinamide-phosphate guanylyltransferase
VLCRKRCPSTKETGDKLEQAQLYLVIGGSRSGKSLFAEELCKSLQKKTELAVTYLATCPRIDPEMEARIQAHRERRPADWNCMEETVNPADRIRGLSSSSGILLFDCLSLLLNNWMWEQEKQGDSPEWTEQDAVDRMLDLLQACKKYPHPVVMVTSEVGAGIVPEDKLLRSYRDSLGRMNQLAAEAADAVYAVIAGIPVNLKELQVKL